MILISVDLPAPLSPSRPSTSPLRRCRLTSRRAVTGPKRLAMCSTRSTSSGAETGPTIVSPFPKPGLSGEDTGGIGRTGMSGTPAHALQIRFYGHPQEDRKAQVEELIVGV